ncbi:hypothetical protein PC129_g12497 [Phytophthora cactorum]|uniref:Uncharacterized protein n=1 Tax=Phytophthora cactorum TaxID=29920 RepID=A0A8T1KBL4_9STRA|nr:hypothetical protein Pcac1_g16502 [Phytophthora cactorum]KAG2814562.1 hypothetical protein PC112_g14276 [Phytophthora cactorum]KAG2816534.1 hypothetical protein PC111_g13111 [Phytophthora cactorum]KAG2853077.1 hypothetical protein PC113_g14475 [Phytophthora cactorum]KAG2895488.1 hypothetical protein PC114_g15473 [Phytophthora cactorum]
MGASARTNEVSQVQTVKRRSCLAQTTQSSKSTERAEQISRFRQPRPRHRDSALDDPSDVSYGSSPT